jgi:hypothetical protein
MEISLEASKFRKRPTTFFMTGAHTKRDLKKRKKQTVSFGGRANARPFHVPPASRERKKAKPKMARRAATRRKTGRHSTRGVDL